MRKILITNDDGIQADGIVRLAAAAVKFGTVYLVAPDGERSAASHSLTLRHPIDIKPVSFPVAGVEAYACSGLPADCVRIGIRNIVKEKPDLVMTGINLGPNCGTDIQYSATVGSALEAATEGIHAIAFSENTGGFKETTDKYLEEIMAELIDIKPDREQIWNVNFPACPLSECRGILHDRKMAACGYFRDTYEEELLPDGTRRMMVNGVHYDDAGEGTDIRAILDNYISIGRVNNLS